MRNILLVILLSCTLIACDTKQVYNHFQSLPIQGWYSDSLLSYTFAITDSCAQYDMQLIVRHTAQYPYQNLWFFTEEWYGNVLLQRDTVECFLADDYGRWIGKGINTFTLPILYFSSHTFPRTGEYTFIIQQGMRTEWLKGINNVGLQITKQ